MLSTKARTCCVIDVTSPAGRGGERASDLLNRSVDLEAEPDLRSAAIEVVVDAILIFANTTSLSNCWLISSGTVVVRAMTYNTMTCSIHFNSKVAALAQAPACATIAACANCAC